MLSDIENHFLEDENETWERIKRSDKAQYVMLLFVLKPHFHRALRRRISEQMFDTVKAVRWRLMQKGIRFDKFSRTCDNEKTVRLNGA